MIKTRYLQTYICQDLLKKMVFIGGARQVGKTTMTRNIIKGENSYLNWDNLKHRELIVRNQLGDRSPQLIFDEIHKFAKWRNYIKGFYDTYGDRVKILVTGSARLDHFKKGGDSLFGRYHYFRLHPFSLRELSQSPGMEDTQALLHLGGFPEPILSASQKTYRRWALERLNRVIYSDINDLEHIKEISLLEVLIGLLKERVGQPLSIEKLRLILQVSHSTVSRWLDILESLYVCYRVPLFTSSLAPSVRKRQKLYLWDWPQAESKGARFENMVASQLLKYCHFIEDTEGRLMELRYLRDREGRELDFVVLQDKKPLFALECKVQEQTLSKSISYFRERIPIPEFYQVHLGQRDSGFADRGGRSLPFWKFCQIKQMP